MGFDDGADLFDRRLELGSLSAQRRADRVRLANGRTRKGAPPPLGDAQCCFRLTIVLLALAGGLAPSLLPGSLVGRDAGWVAAAAVFAASYPRARRRQGADQSAKIERIRRYRNWRFQERTMPRRGLAPIE
jgi:hypothetical protein